MIKEKYSILQKARILEQKIRVKHETNKQIKQRTYQLFLQNPNRELPSYQKLKRWRRRLATITIICIAIPGIQIVFFHNTLYFTPKPLYFNQQPTLEQILMQTIKDIPTIFGIVFFIMLSFTMAVDWVIYRRWNTKRSILKW